MHTGVSHASPATDLLLTVNAGKVKSLPSSAYFQPRNTNYREGRCFSDKECRYTLARKCILMFSFLGSIGETFCGRDVEQPVCVHS